MKAKSQAIALMYHRIDYTETDTWNICVTPEHFEQQVQFLKNNFNVISVEQLINQIKQNNIRENSVCITFDDGYADNFIHAKPVLEKYNCPATFFIPTAFIGKKFFWWDELEYIFLHTKKLPAYLSFETDGKPYAYHIKETLLTSEQFNAHTKWKWYDDAPTARCNVFMQIREALQPLHFSKIQKVIDELKIWAEIKEDNHLHRYTMHEAQLQTMAKQPLFSIGLHTHTHADLESINELYQHNEILNSKNILANNFNIQSNILAYPYGLYNEQTLNVANALNLDACFTTETGIINHTSNLYALNRMQVCNWNADYFHQQLLNVFSKNI